MMDEIRVLMLPLTEYDNDACEVCGCTEGRATRLTMPDGTLRALWACEPCVRAGGDPLRLALDLQSVQSDWRERADAWAADEEKWGR